MAWPASSVPDLTVESLEMVKIRNPDAHVYADFSTGILGFRPTNIRLRKPFRHVGADGVGSKLDVGERLELMTISLSSSKHDGPNCLLKIETVNASFSLQVELGINASSTLRPNELSTPRTVIFSGTL